MSEIEAQTLYRRWKSYVAGESIRRITLASGVSEEHGVWSLDVVEYLASGVDVDAFLKHAKQTNQLGTPLPASFIRRQIELRVGFEVKVMPCPVRIEHVHLTTSRARMPG